MSVYEKDRFDWLEAAVESILNQDYEEFHFYIVIDGSVEKKIHEYLVSVASFDERVSLYQASSNLGLSSAMNFIINLIQNSSIEYFFRMDADDISIAHRLSTQIAYLDNYKNIDVLGSALIEVDEKGQIVGRRKLPLTHGDIVKFLPKRCSMNHPTVVLRTKLFTAGFRYNEGLRNTQDYFLWATLVASGYRFANLSQELIQFRRVNNFYKRRGLSKSLNEFKARWYTMKTLRRVSVGNILYACCVLFLRFMPAKLVKIAYKIDRHLLEWWVKH